MIGCYMFRLTALLSGVIFLVLLIGGQDRGQVRQGLMAAAVVPDAAPVIVAAPVPEPDATAAVFVPAQPVRTAPATPEVVPVVAAAVIVAEPEPTPDARIAYVDARSINVRAGPSTDQDIVGRLTRGEAVLVVQAQASPNGWTLIRIEGDGIEGYVASRLLTDLAP